MSFSFVLYAKRIFLSGLALLILAAPASPVFGSSHPDSQLVATISGTASGPVAGSLLFSNSKSNVSIATSGCGLNSMSGKVYSDSLGFVDMSSLSVSYVSGQSTAAVQGSVATPAGGRIYFNSNGGNVTITNVTAGSGSAIPFSGEAKSPTLGAISFSGVTTLWRPNCTNPTASVDIKANGENGSIIIPNGGTAVLTWASSDTGATSCAASGAWSGSKETSGNFTTPAITTNSTFTLTCGLASDSVSVNVGAQVPTGGKFQIGDRVRVAVSSLNVRITPGGTKIGTVSLGAQGIVKAGPTDASDFTWWQVQYDSGVLGWSVEGVEGVEFLIKAIDVPGGGGGAAFSLGDRVRPTANLRVRSAPSLSAATLTIKSTADTGQIIGDPIFSSPYQWWQIRWSGGLEGWSAEGDETRNYLVKAGDLVMGSSELQIGNTVKTTVALNVRESSSASAPVIRFVLSGTTGQVLEGPSSAAGRTWWRIRYNDAFGTTGWSAEGDAFIKYLVKI